MVVKSFLIPFVFCLMSFVLPVAAAEDEVGFDRWYVGLSGQLMLPQGGSRMHHVGGAALRGGYYFTEDWAIEGEAAWLEDAAGLSAELLGHFQGWSAYGDLFGYSRFDPFATLGARGWIGRDSGQVGPKAGLGAFYHLTDEWALRADADATLGLETNCEMLYSLSVGVQYSF
ncbi:MAG: hypothetical protein KBT68_11225 [bacterium]|nr:hypothetical protein [Candidatus Colisoma equi]